MGRAKRPTSGGASYIQVSTGQYNFAKDPNTEYGHWCSWLYNRDTNTHHARRCGLPAG
jgi:hypothetical protein